MTGRLARLRESAAGRAVATALVRGVVPAWLLAGAAFKLVEASPATLPRHSILAPASALGLHDRGLFALLVTLIAAESLLAGVMIFVDRLARPAAILVLTVFVGILANELRAGASSCGCFGSHSPPLPLMMAIDDGLLIAILVLGPRGGALRARGVALALATGALGAALAFGIVMRAAHPPPLAPSEVEGRGGAPAVPTPTAVPPDPTRNPAPLAQAFYMTPPDAAELLAKRWRDLELFKLMPVWPAGLDEGRHHVVFFRRSCDHCQGLFLALAAATPDAPVIAIEVPESKTALRGDDAWDMPPGVKADLGLALPLGCDYSIQTPLVLTIEGGVVSCAEEGDYRRCIQMQ